MSHSKVVVVESVVDVGESFIVEANPVIPAAITLYLLVKMLMSLKMSLDLWVPVSARKRQYSTTPSFLVAFEHTL